MFKLNICYYSLILIIQNAIVNFLNMLKVF